MQVTQMQTFQLYTIQSQMQLSVKTNKQTNK